MITLDLGQFLSLAEKCLCKECKWFPCRRLSEECKNCNNDLECRNEQGHMVGCNNYKE